MNTLNPFMLQDDPVANLTDLHAFVVDKDRKPILEESRLAESDQLVLSLCVRRRLLPNQIASLEGDVSKYAFRIHLALNPQVRFFDEKRTRDGRDYQDTLKSLNNQIANLGALPEQLADVRSQMQKRGQLISDHEFDHSMQALYGGIIQNPETIAEDAVLDFRLKFAADAENSDVSLDEKQTRIEGIPGPINIVAENRRSADGARELVKSSPWRPDAINIQCGIFDDPFIFPRFFRANVVGIVVSIPLKKLHRPDGTLVKDGPVFLWATTHRPDGKQSDHVGRSLRTQLPRFGYLNELPPWKHLAAITRVHANPNLLENVFITFIPPLEAHRHYDSVPDVMIYDLTKVPRFPNGRWLADDVAKTLADAGETLLLELSYAESKQFPRSTVNDKPFRLNFPYLAERWTASEIMEHSKPGSTFGTYKVPDAPDRDALATPDFHLNVWKSISTGLCIGVVVVGAIALFALSNCRLRIGVAVLVLLGLVIVLPIGNLSDSMNPKQPQQKFIRTLTGSALVGLLGIIVVAGISARYGVRLHNRKLATNAMTAP